MLTYRDISTLVKQQENEKQMQIANAYSEDNFFEMLEDSANSNVEVEYDHLLGFLSAVTIPERSLLELPELHPYHAHVLHAIITADKKNNTSLYHSNAALIGLAKKVEEIINDFPEIEDELHDVDVFSELVLVFAERDMLDSVILTELIRVKRDDDLMLVLETLDKSGLLTKEMLTFVLSHSQLNNMVMQVIGMEKRKYEGDDIATAVEMLIYLLRANVLCADYEMMDLLELPELNDLVRLVGAIHVFSLADVLTTELFGDLIANAHVFSEARVPQWLQFPPEGCSVEFLLDVLELSRLAGDDQATALENVRVALQAFIAHQENEAEVMPDAQNTHTASIHKSVSTSAERLWKLYGDQINEPYKLKAYLDRIATWLNRLPETDAPTDKVRAAKIAFASMRGSSFSDPESKINIPQMLALAWIAMRRKHYQSSVLRVIGVKKDEFKDKFIFKFKDKFKDKFQDAFFAQVFMPLLDGLYECQRGYNLNKDRVDDGAQDDRNICLPGKFNKILEKLVGVHEAVELYFLKHEDVVERLGEVVRQHIDTYLKSMSHEQMKAFIEFFDATMPKEDSFEPTEGDKKVWSVIKDSVIAQMRKENLHTAYGNDENRFMQTIEGALYGIGCEDWLKSYRVQSPISPLRATSLFSPRKARASLGPVEDKENVTSSINTPYKGS